MPDANAAAAADDWDKVLFLFLGWLLATLSPIIADAVRRKREIKETRTALLGELSELKYRFALVVFSVESEYKGVTRKLIDWVRRAVNGYKGSMLWDELHKTIATLENLSDEQLTAWAAMKGRPSDVGLSLKRYPAPFLESRLKDVAWLPVKIQALMIEVHTQIAIIDAELDNIQYYFRMTFDSSVTGENRRRVEQNLKLGYQHYAKAGRNIVDRIVSLEDAWASPSGV